MAVDQLIPARRFKQRHHHDRHLLPLLGQGGEKPALALRPPEPQVRVPLVELVKFQIHREIPDREHDLSRPNPAARIACAPHP